MRGISQTWIYLRIPSSTQIRLTLKAALATDDQGNLRFLDLELLLTELEWVDGLCRTCAKRIQATEEANAGGNSSTESQRALHPRRRCAAAKVSPLLQQIEAQD
jgi:hypothetical protein